MTGALWVCEACNNLYGGPRGLECSCGRSAPERDDGYCEAWAGEETEFAAMLDAPTHQSASFLDHAVAASRSRRSNGKSALSDRFGLDDIDYRDIDPLIRPFVRTLRYHGIHTFMSCQGGDGHPDRLPWVSFTGDYRAAGRVAALADHYCWRTLYLDRRFLLRAGNLGHVLWVLIFDGLTDADAADAHARLIDAKRNDQPTDPSAPSGAETDPSELALTGT